MLIYAGQQMDPEMQLGSFNVPPVRPPISRSSSFFFFWKVCCARLLAAVSCESASGDEKLLHSRRRRRGTAFLNRAARLCSRLISTSSLRGSRTLTAPTGTDEPQGPR